MFAASKRNAAIFMAKAVVPTASVVVTSYCCYSNGNGTKVDCEAVSETARLKSDAAGPNLRKRMTAIGRFSLKSETPKNPSIPAFFVALAGHPKHQPDLPFSSVKRFKPDNGMTFSEFENMWYERDFDRKHERFLSKVSESDDRFFEPSPKNLSNYVNETLHYSIYRSELKRRIEHMLTADLDVNKQLWEAFISSGRLGSSGAISGAKVRNIEMSNPSVHNESVIVFRAHHALADGVSLGAAMADLADEADELRESIELEWKKSKKLSAENRKKLNWLHRLARYIRNLIGFWVIGTARALVNHGYLLLVSKDPFDEIIRSADEELDDAASQSDPSIVKSTRSVSWCDAAPVEQVKKVARILSRHATVNDIFVACVSYAVAKQLEDHQRASATKLALPEFINVVIPVHLYGGVLLPGESVGNRIGAVVARIPASLAGHDELNEGADRLKKVSKALINVKNTPAAFIGYFTAKFLSEFIPEEFSKILFRNANCSASVVVSNVRGPSSKLHWNGRTVESIAGFLPLPPGIPIGVVVQSYDGMVSLTVTADSKAVPDADKFLAWMLEEYQRMCNEAGAKLEEGETQPDNTPFFLPPEEIQYIIQQDFKELCRDNAAGSFDHDGEEVMNAFVAGGLREATELRLRKIA